MHGTRHSHLRGQRCVFAQIAQKDSEGLTLLFYSFPGAILPVMDSYDVDECTLAQSLDDSNRHLRNIR
jgi:hypothetical protein